MPERDPENKKEVMSLENKLSAVFSNKITRKIGENIIKKNPFLTHP